MIFIHFIYVIKLQFTCTSPPVTPLVIFIFMGWNTWHPQFKGKMYVWLIVSSRFSLKLSGSKAQRHGGNTPVAARNLWKKRETKGQREGKRKMKEKRKGERKRKGRERREKRQAGNKNMLFHSSVVNIQSDPSLWKHFQLLILQGYEFIIVYSAPLIQPPFKHTKHIENILKLQ